MPFNRSETVKGRGSRDPVFGGITSRRGAHSELLACAWLLEQGFEVFRNVSPTGSVDVVAIREGETLHLDIKTAAVGRAPKLAQRQIDAGILPLYVFLDGKCEIDRAPISRERGRCRACDTTFEKRHRYQIFCTLACRSAYRAENPNPSYRSPNPPPTAERLTEIGISGAAARWRGHERKGPSRAKWKENVK